MCKKNIYIDSGENVSTAKIRRDERHFGGESKYQELQYIWSEVEE